MLWRKTSRMRHSEEVLGKLFKLQRSTFWRGSLERLFRLRRTEPTQFYSQRRRRILTEKWPSLSETSEELQTGIREVESIKSTTITQEKFSEILGSPIPRGKRRYDR